MSILASIDETGNLPAQTKMSELFFDLYNGSDLDSAVTDLLHAGYLVPNGHNVYKVSHPDL